MTLKKKFSILYTPILVFTLVVGVIASVLRTSGTAATSSHDTGKDVKVMASKETYTCDSLSSMYSKTGMD